MLEKRLKNVSEDQPHSSSIMPQRQKLTTFISHESECFGRELDDECPAECNGMSCCAGFWGLIIPCWLQSCGASGDDPHGCWSGAGQTLQLTQLFSVIRKEFPVGVKSCKTSPQDTWPY